MSLHIPRWMGTNPDASGIALCDAQTDYDYSSQRASIALLSKSEAGLALVYGEVKLPRAKSNNLYGGLMSLSVQVTVNIDGSADVHGILLAGGTESYDVSPAA